MPETRSATSLLIAFLDLTRFGAQSQRVGDARPALRRRFKKHTPPITYIRHEDTRRMRGTGRR